MPFSSCEKVRKSKGNTHTSIELMIQQVVKHYKQVSKIAPILKGKNLEITCVNIHSFLYNHFQYLADKEDQILRSPACSWQQRFKGIDCKSYSIIASCLLINLKIKHYIRKIKQPNFNPAGYTHVYIVVPYNQNTGDLKQGYFTIDGTLKTTIEPTFIETKDFYMDLPHFALNGTTETGGTSSTNENINLSLDGVEAFFQVPISCWGGTAFNATTAKTAFDAVESFMVAEFTKINKAVATNDVLLLAQLDYNINKAINGGYWAYVQKKKRGWNTCTNQSFDKMIKYFDFFVTVVLPSYEAWINQYYDIKTIRVKEEFSTQYENAPYSFYFSYLDNPADRIEVKERSFAKKPNITTIKAFEFTPYIEQVASGSTGFTPAQYLQSLSTILVATTGGTTVGGSQSGGSYGTDNGATDTKKDNTILYVVGAGVIGFLGFKLLTKKNK